MDNIILVAGATGNLGSKIIDALVAKNANIRAVVRLDSDKDKIELLEKKGVKVLRVDMTNQHEMTSACLGVSCVVSALSGLREVIIDYQKILLDAAIEAKVPRFIPSDYSLDFTNLTDGTNRNFDLRREFHKYLDNVPIKATTVFNGAFMDLLTGDMPLILFKNKRILAWGNPEIKMDLTTTYNVAEFTAKVALDNTTPRFLRIAGDSVNALDVKNIMQLITNQKFGLFRPGGIGLLNIIIKITKFFTKSSEELYPAWQGMQYMRDMMEGKAMINTHDNNRYNDINWTNVKTFLISENAEAMVNQK